MTAVDRQIPTIGCWLLVLVRVAIGWHLLYEGLWKIQSQHTTAPWSAEGYLKNATGPMRTTFREMTGDPNDLKWLDYDAMSAKWDGWYQRFTAHYFSGANSSDVESAKARLDALLNGQPSYSVKLDKLPEAIKNKVLVKTKIDGADQPVLWYESENKRLVVDGKLHLLPSELERAKNLVPGLADLPMEKILLDKEWEKTANLPPDVVNYVKALVNLDKLQSKLSFRERLAATLKGDPERIGVVQQTADGAVIENRMGEIEHYKQKIDRYEAKLRETNQAFEWNHLERMWRELQEQRAQLVNPVKALENELKVEAEKLLTPEQLARGPVPEPMTPMRRINLQTMWGLTIIGGLLIAGLFTRLASFAGAGLLFMFYLAVPPLPGTPPEAGPEHNFIVNKVLVESLMLLAFTALPSGRWFGVDSLIGALFRRWREESP